MSLTNGNEWLSVSPVAVSRGAPSPAAAAAPSMLAPPSTAGSNPSGGDEGVASQKAIVVAGTIAVASLVGYTVYQSMREATPQVLFMRDEDVARAHRRIFFVNLSSQDRELASRALQVWLPSAFENVQHTFEDVTFYDEGGSRDDTVASVRDSVRHAALTAFADLSRRHSDVSCVVVYRSAMTIDGEPVELMESNTKTLQRADKKVLHERHCLGFTVDGKGAAVVVRDVVGILDANLAREVWPRASDMEATSMPEVLRRCCLPTEGTLQQHTVVERQSRLLGLDGIVMGDAAASSSVSALSDRRLLAPSGGTAGAGRQAEALWRSSFLLFCELGACLRMGRQSYHGVCRLLTKQPEPGWDGGGALRGLGGAWRRLWQFLWRTPTEAESATTRPGPHGASAGGLTRLPLSGHFCIVLCVEEGTDAGAMGRLPELVASLVGHVLGLRTLSHGPRTLSHGPPGADSGSCTPLLTCLGQGGHTCVIVDLADVEPLCSILQAHHIASLLLSSMSALGIVVVAYSLYAATPSADLEWYVPPATARENLTLCCPKHEVHDGLRRAICGLPPIDRGDIASTVELSRLSHCPL